MVSIFFSTASGRDMLVKNNWKENLELKTFNQYLLDPHHHLSAFPQLQFTKVAKIRDHQAPLIFQETLDLSLQQSSGRSVHTVRGEEHNPS